MSFRNKIGLSLGLLCAVCLWGCSAIPSARVDRQAAEERYEKIRRNKNKLVVGGSIGKVRWAEDRAVLKFTRGNNAFIVDLKKGLLASTKKNYDGLESANVKPRKRRHPGRGKQRPTAPSPDGKWTAACEDWNVVLKNDDDGSKPIRVTTEGNQKLRYGTASWVYGEELYQNDALWWSPDSKKLAFYKFDEQLVKDFYLIGDLTKVRTKLMTEGYPKAGEPNPVASLLIYDLQSKKTVEVDCGDDPEQYVYNVRFRPDGKELLFNRTNRHQNVLELTAADPKTGRSRIVVTEKQDTWQHNLPKMRFLEDSKRFIWETEKTGWAQYELRHIDGSLICTLTKGKFPVENIEFVDEKSGWIYYTAYTENFPLNLQLYKARLDGTEQKLLTEPERTHSDFQIAPGGKWFTAKGEANDAPPSTGVYDAEGKRIATLAKSDNSKVAELGLEPPELFSFKTGDGKADIYGVLYKPSNFDPGRKYPLIVDVYGGPGVGPRVRNRYRPARAETEYGFLIAVMDNRGTPKRGKAFESATYLKLGIVDIQDQVDGVKYLAKRPYVDGRRVGIVGSSYGGYMSALGPMKFPEVFHAGVAKSAVSDWKNYDTIYTERYMRTPKENEEGYRDGSCLTYVDRFKGHLLIMHGLVDDNVHPNNIWQLIDALDRAGKPYESRFFPRSGHGLSRDSSRTQWDFFRRHLIEEFDE